MSGIEWTLSGLSRSEDSETSKDAGSLIDAAWLMSKIYEAMSRFGEKGCIGDDVERLLPGIPFRSISPRFVQMVNMGMIELTGETRIAASGRQQEVRRVLPAPFSPPKSKRMVRMEEASHAITELSERVRKLEERILELSR